MRWLSYFILAYVLLGLQLSLGDYAQIRGVGPNLMLLAVVFVSLNAKRDAALLGSFILGALQDLVTLQPLGLYAFAYGLTAMMIVGLSALLDRGHPLTHLGMTLLGGVVTAIVLIINSLVHPIEPAHLHAGVLIPAVRLSIRAICLGMVVYPAVLSPFVIGVLHRMGPVFGFDLRRRKSW